ncbi:MULTISPECIES: NAD(P)/FAD-dependent oxidoreductase [unclassified Parafrankia]|uniref:NAD(P)/FAD-dependent oxidoreductase n=1 Tax=unclassified Parafrankia TaxID=2994368 RepID=UPI000DA4D45D|nr:MULTISPECIES: tryptophan 7-halogenase [unclassified Parafrankia]TCJ37940.1 FAD-dependent oxidoreductase [Parafrankia sp. BMG5.11]SQD97117.1 Monodechloroaminopyrrolnitrin halogenase PrnC [Parafrankia sp. Ea1.12]
MSEYDYSVAILGSGIAGSTLANILARHGHSVVLIDSGTHPRFALGESTIGETTYLLKLLAQRFDVPELGHVSSFEGVRQHVSSACGVKRNFGFVYHREGEIQDPEEVTQCSVSEFPNGPEMHMHRQDIDSYLFYSAVRHGAHPRQRTFVDHVEITDDAATLTTRAGERIRVRYVVDASGRNSVLANQYGLREDPCRFRTHSRTLFTHMVGVTPFDEVTRPSGQPSPWHQGTLHHIFDGGWLWVIPFDNHQSATNPLCSVGLNLDTRRFPKQPGVTADEEWQTYLDRFPSVARQFAAARPTWDWVSTGRTQYSSTRTVGDRWTMMSHAAGAIDALFSRGMANTMQVIYAFAPMLMDALTDGDLSAERFASIDQLNQTILDVNDRLVAGSYTSFQDFDLWRAWSKVWFMAWNLGISRIVGTYFGFLERGDPALFDRLFDAPFPGTFCPDLPEFQDLFRRLGGVMDEVDQGQATPTEAVGRLADLLGTAAFLPEPLRLGDVLRRWHDGSFDAQRQMYEWGRSASPRPLRRWYDYDLDVLLARSGGVPQPVTF